MHLKVSDICITNFYSLWYTGTSELRHCGTPDGSKSAQPLQPCPIWMPPDLTASSAFFPSFKFIFSDYCSSILFFLAMGVCIPCFSCSLLPSSNFYLPLCSSLPKLPRVSRTNKTNQTHRIKVRPWAEATVVHLLQDTQGDLPLHCGLAVDM